MTQPPAGDTLAGTVLSLAGERVDVAGVAAGGGADIAGGLPWVSSKRPGRCAISGCNKDLPQAGEEYTASIAGHGVAMLRVRP